MKLTLVGPTLEGFWFLENADGLSWQLVERWLDLPGAASLFGWASLAGTSDDEQGEAAKEFLMEHIGHEINAPLHIAQHFEEMEREISVEAESFESSPKDQLSHDLKQQFPDAEIEIGKPTIQAVSSFSIW